ncbi:MAG: tRNA pseudouridine(13) synthase TruD [Phycisphaerae bacterium]|nr:tRNA pseudouridine(13) synthase TruD [Phycisphaerae bacterium]
MPTLDLPRQLRNFKRAPALIKADYEDFVVEEIPLYEACGSGTHTYFLIEKTGLATQHAIHDIAHALNVRRRDIGYAGQKDARAVTRQWMSVEHVEPEKIEALHIPRIEILKVTRHNNKLKLGHLQGNRFWIRARQTTPDRLAEFQDALARLAELGVPNSFGTQRFGGRGDTWEVGRAMVHNNIDEAIDVTLGRPSPSDHGSVRHARELYEAGHYAEAARQWPSMFRDQRRALRALAKSGGKRKRAFIAIDRSTREFYISAYQSYLFNQVVAARIESGLGRLMQGDLAWLHKNGAVFEVEDTAAEQERADRLEISPTGPLFGYRMSKPTGEPGRLESEVLSNEGLTPESFHSERLRVKGGRRPLRFQITDPGIRLGADGAGAYLELRFVLPRGCYATIVLNELFVDTQPGDTGIEDDGTDTISGL